MGFDTGPGRLQTGLSSLKKMGVNKQPSSAPPSEKRNREEKKKTWDYAASAMMAGVVTKSTCAPLERIRLLYQVQGMFGNSRGDAVKYRSLSHTAKTIFREEGLSGFWKGNWTNMIRAAVVYALKFGTNDIMKARMLRDKKKKASALALDDPQR